MILKETLVMKEFSKRFNSKLNSLDFTEYAPRLMDIINNKVDLNQKFKIGLPCKNENVFNQLVSFDYIELISELIKRLKIEEECYDNFLSLMEPNLIELYIDVILKMKPLTLIEANNSTLSFDVHCPELMMHLLWSPISQLHFSIQGELEHLNGGLSISKKYYNLTVDENKFEHNLFINSKVSTPFSYFILAFIAENLNIPLEI